MPVRTSEAQWNGTLREGSGTMKLGSGAFQGAYSFVSRFEEGQGSNPEELIAAAHAGCFSMALAGNLVKAHHPSKSIRTTAKVHIDKTGDGFSITRIDLNTEAEVPGITPEEFQQQAEAAKKGCPVSRALAAVPEITLNAKLV